MTSVHDPRRVYEERLQERRARHEHLSRLDRRLSASRGIVFGVGLLIWWVVVGPQVITPWILLLPVAAFIVIVVVHERTVDAAARAGRAVRFYERGLARLDGTWAGTGDAGDDFLDPLHPYAADLDVLGRGSLFEMISVARTQAGRRRLADWLLAPAAPVEIRERQAAVAELAPGLDLREELTVLADALKRRGDETSLRRWAATDAAPVPRFAAFVSAALAAANVAAVVAAFVIESIDPVLVSGLLSIGWAMAWRSRVQAAIAGVEGAGQGLALHGRVLRCIEEGHFTSPRLLALQARLTVDGHPPSHEIARLARYVDLLESRRNQMLMLLAGPLLWTTQLGLAVGAWRARSAPSIAVWLDTVAEFEALASFAGHAWEHPGDTWPEVVDGTDPVFEARGAAHPLLPDGRCVRNDVAFGDVRLLLVSGSNMSGKSTLMRTAGTNVVLALAGAPVRALHLRLGVLHLGASIRVTDSLLEGRSRFFAEITRLRQIVDLAAATPPLLFLLDEVLHGTNSADRKAGAEAIVRGLLRRGALGIVTTHDLSLAEAVETLGPVARNVHFEDHLSEGGLAFDYTLKPGVVQRSNALALMRAVGLEV